MLEKNLSLLKKKDPHLFEDLRALSPPLMQVVETRSGVENLYSLPNEYYYHSNYDPLKEAYKQVKDLNLENTQVLYFFGLGLGYIFDAVESWLEKEEHYLVFLEPDLQAVQGFLGAKRASKVLQHPRVYLFHLPQDAGGQEKICEQLTHYFIQLSFVVRSLPLYEKCHFQVYAHIKQKLSHCGAVVNYASFEMTSHGRPFFKNFYQNLFEVKSLHSMLPFKEAFKGFPAIICGAGPSLNKNFSSLQALKNHALIFSGGSSLAALTNRGLTPHFGASVDPNPTQYHRMFHQSGHECPTIFKLRIHSQSLKVLHGPKLYLGGAGSYPITDWVEEKWGLNTFSFIQEGYNVLHMLMDLVRVMGCNPIIFVGLDLAYTGLKSYADCIVQKHLTDLSLKEITSQKHINDNAFLKESVYGGKVYTLWKWVNEANYTAKYATQYPEVKFINCTEGGLGIAGLTHMSLKEVQKQISFVPFDTYGFVQQKLHSEKPKNLSREKTQELVAFLKDDLKACQELLLQEVREVQACLQDKRPEKALENPAFFAKLQDLEKQLDQHIAFQKLLFPTNHIHSLCLQRRLKEMEKVNDLSQKEKLLKRWEATLQQLLFYLDTAKVNQAFVEKALNLYSHR